MLRAREVIRACWLEYVTTKQVSTGNGAMWLTRLAALRGEIGTPRWFRHEELGLAVECGPSVMWNLENLADTNRRNKVQLKRNEKILADEQARILGTGPAQVRRLQKMSGKERARRMKAMLKTARAS